MTIPAAPRIRIAQVLGTGSVRLAWDAVPGADSYGVYRADDSMDPDDLAPLDTVTATAYDDRTAAAGHFYLYGVTTVDGSDESPEALKKVNVRARSDASDSVHTGARRIAGRVLG